jgi:hypothetical protein
MLSAHSKDLSTMETTPLKQRVRPQGCAEIEERAKALLESHPLFSGHLNFFDLQCCGDVLTVRGCVPTYYLKQILQTVLKNLDGVRLVDNQVTVDISEGIVGPISSRYFC